jgi:hypothetical protein
LAAPELARFQERTMLASRTREPWSRRLQLAAGEPHKYRRARQQQSAGDQDLASLCAKACAAISAEKASLDRLSQAARRRHAQLRRAESCRLFVNILASSLHDASDASVSAACVALDQPELRACLEAAGATVAELRMLTAYRLHNQQLLDAWEARCGAADTHTHTHTLATLLPLECVAHAFVYGLPPYPAIEAPPAWLEHGVGSGAWLEPPVEPSGGATPAATAAHHSPTPLPAMPIPAMPIPAMASPIGALLRRSAALTAPLLFGSASSGRGFHEVLDAQLRAQAASERAEGAAEDAGLSAELLGLPGAAHRPSMRQAAAAAAAATVAAAAAAAATVAPEAEVAEVAAGAGPEMLGGVVVEEEEEEGLGDGDGGAPSRWLLLCRVLRGAPSLSSPGTAAAAAVLPLFAVQLDGDGRGGGGGGGAPAGGRDLPGRLDQGAAPEAHAGTHVRRGSRSGGGAPTPALAPAPAGAAPPALLDSTAAWPEWQTAHAHTDTAAAAVRRRVATALDDVRAAHAPARVQAQAESAQGEVELQLLLAEARKELARLKKSNHALEHQYVQLSHT